MRLLYFAALFLIVFGSCSQKPKHPQAEIINKGLPAPVTEQAIVQFADSINANLSSYQKQSSLVFHRADSTFYVEEYRENGVPVLFKTYTENAGVSSASSEYYFNRGSMILMKENIRKTRQNGETIEEKRVFLRNNIAFKTELRTGLSKSSILQQKFTAKEQAIPSSDNFADVMAKVNDAINASNEFDLVFDKLISSPGEKHIVLKSKVPNGYSASIVVRDTDLLIDSLTADPSIFKDQKLKIKWEVEDKEAVYVPVANTTTSASGLNK